RASLGRLRQVAKLSGGKVPAPAELETAEAALERSKVAALEYASSGSRASGGGIGDQAGIRP
ncbi:MAG TPA: hypothetical protein PK954_12105, partial [Anaerolineales bacterium]|nr:hypothetical protein [Anaerolineales bacterium]